MDALLVNTLLALSNCMKLAIMLLLQGKKSTQFKQEMYKIVFN